MARTRLSIEAEYRGWELGKIGGNIDRLLMVGGIRIETDNAEVILEEVDEYIVAEGVGCGEESTSAVELHHPLDEVAQVVALVEHKRVDADPVPRAAHDLFQRLFDGHR